MPKRVRVPYRLFIATLDRGLTMINTTHGVPEIQSSAGMESKSVKVATKVSRR